MMWRDRREAAVIPAVPAALLPCGVCYRRVNGPFCLLHPRPLPGFCVVLAGNRRTPDCELRLLGNETPGQTYLKGPLLR